MLNLENWHSLFISLMLQGVLLHDPLHVHVAYNTFTSHNNYVHRYHNNKLVCECITCTPTTVLLRCYTHGVVSGSSSILRGSLLIIIWSRLSISLLISTIVVASLLVASLLVASLLVTRLLLVATLISLRGRCSRVHVRVSWRSLSGVGT